MNPITSIQQAAADLSPKDKAKVLALLAEHQDHIKVEMALLHEEYALVSAVRTAIEDGSPNVPPVPPSRPRVAHRRAAPNGGERVQPRKRRRRKA